MHALLGIDAAWTPAAPSGVALIVGEVGRWRCVRAAPSRRAFVAEDGRAEIDFAARIADDDVPLDVVLTIACKLAGVPTISVLAVDMPLAHGPITGRRVADSLVSREYGARGCAVHSPTAARPGALASRARDDALACGLPLVTQGQPRTPALIEVYPHVTLLDLVGSDYRLRYKLARARKYWPTRSASERAQLLLATWWGIEMALERVLGALPERIEPSASWPKRALKGYEDALDGVICAWTAALYLEGRAVPLGDADAAIWVPAAGRPSS